MRRLVLVAIAVVLTLLGGAALVLVLLDHHGPSAAERARAAVRRFDAAWARGDDARAARQTDQPAVAARSLAADRRGLDGATVTPRLLGVTATGPLRRARVQLTWRVPGYGDWSYVTGLTLRATAGGLRVVWTPQLVHPALTASTRLGTERTGPPRAPILDADGQALVVDRPVVQVGLERARVRDVQTSARSLATVLGLDARALARQLRGAGPKEFVVALTLRERDYRRVAVRVDAVPGAAAVPSTLALTPSRRFGRALLGAVGPATAEQVKASGGRLAVGDNVGQWGLEQTFDKRLAGTPTTKIIVRDAATGAPVRTLAMHAGTNPEPLRTTLSSRVQTAAESALGGARAPEALVAVRPSTGEVLAVADRPVDSTFDRALAGAYAPGSTFKVVTTAALIRHGLDPRERVSCPPRITVDGRTFRNFEGESGSGGTFADDFAISCNTAFISLAGRLPATALRATARDYGLGPHAQVPAGTARSHVPTGRDRVARAAAMIGQDRIVVSPLAMAGVAATVAAGQWHAPRLLSTDPERTDPPLPASEAATLRALMRGVVTHGTARVLAGVPGAVAGKTGTAEFGRGNPPPTHAWFIGFRGDLALAVLVERGRSGGSAAAPLAARFFRAYDRIGG